MTTPPCVLTIAGSDSGSGAGIQADLKAIHANGGYALTAIVAITAQNTREVRAAFDVPVPIVEAQLETLRDDFAVAAAKTGMLSSAPLVRAVAAHLRARPVPHLVVDPVMVSTSGYRLLAAEAEAALRTELLPLATIVTPNRAEAEVLAGHPIDGRAAAEAAARAIHALGPRAVLVKGGHGEGAEAVDLLFDGAAVTELRAPRLQTRNTHGTGCTLSAAIAARLARGDALAAAVGTAKRYVTEAIRRGFPLGQGHGPTNHLWALPAFEPAE